MIDHDRDMHMSHVFFMLVGMMQSYKTYSDFDKIPHKEFIMHNASCIIRRATHR